MYMYVVTNVAIGLQKPIELTYLLTDKGQQMI